MIEFENLLFYYKKEKPILSAIHATLHPGGIYGLLGLNGVGKTTFLKLIAGLSFPKEGHIRVNGHIPKDRKVEFFEDLFFVTDEVELPKWPVKRLIELYAPFYPKFKQDDFYRLLELFQVDAAAHLTDLSYGQRKKVNIAFGLSTHARVILMDEPTNGLDIPSKNQFRKVISQYVTDDKIIIISTHQIRDIHSLIDRLLILEHTKLVVNNSLYCLSRHIRFTLEPKSDEQILYSERTLQGDFYMVTSTENTDGYVDIEMFFNAISMHPEILQLLPNNSKNEIHESAY